MIDALKVAFIIVVLPWLVWILLTKIPENAWEWYCKECW